MTGSFIGGYVSSGMGRVRTMAFFGVPVTLSSMGIAYASYPLTIHIWSFIQGLGVIVWMTTGSKFVAISIAQRGGKNDSFSALYICEISHKDLRNRLGAMPSQFLAIGFLFSFLLGYLCGWRTTSLISFGISLIATILPLFLPETPYWLIEKNRVKEAQ